MRSVEWDYQSEKLKMIDQRMLPARLQVEFFSDYPSVAEAIRNMTVRGAPAIGAAAAFGLALAAKQYEGPDLKGFKEFLLIASNELYSSRPTAVNLPRALKRILALLDLPINTITEFKVKILSEAQAIADEDVSMNQKISASGAELISDGDTIIHHCNTGALATVDWGTALGVIRMAHEQGKKIHVLVDETRPRLQGSRLTAWELSQYGIPFDIISDGAAGHFLRTGQVQKVFFGADRVAANGDVANKIGTYMLALAAKANSIPSYSVFPTSTLDMSINSGDLIPIEERSQDEVLDLKFKDQPASPEGASARNPAFDITPHELISGLITEHGVIYPPFESKLAQIMNQI